MNKLDVLKKLLHEAKYGDEDGLAPDLTVSEIKALEWAIEIIEGK